MCAVYIYLVNVITVWQRRPDLILERLKIYIKCYVTSICWNVRQGAEKGSIKNQTLAVINL